MKSLVTFLSFTFLFLLTRSQDNCETALPVSVGTYTVDFVNGTELPTSYCVGGAGNTNAAEWYTYTASAEYSVTVTTNLPGNLADTRIHVYTGTCDDLVCYDGDDDSGANYSSIAIFNVDTEVTYYIVFDNYWDSNGFDFQIIESEPLVTLVDFTVENITSGGAVLAALDMNGDFLDDVVSVNGEELEINYQLEGGGFDHQTISTGPVANDPSWSLAGGDLDGNGYNDLLYAGGGGVSFVWANEDGTGYSETHEDQYVFCQRSNMADINGDGHLDAFVCHDISPNVYYINDGSGNLTFNQGGMGDTPDGGNYGSVFIDYDNDCDMDMFIAKCRGGDSAANIDQMHRNDGDGIYTEVGEDIGLADAQQSWSSVWADFDNDGDMDVVVPASSFENGWHKVNRNNGDGTFTEITAGSGFDSFNGTGIDNSPADFNNDGWVDIFCGDGSIMINNGDFTFTNSPTPFYPGPKGDLNNDGFIDVVNGTFVYLNDGNDNNYISINTIGTASNKNGIGARLTLYTPSGNQIRDVRAGEGFRYMSTLNTHFGLGLETEVTKIEVCWPSGAMDEILNPAINTTLTIIEGSNPVSIDEPVKTQVNVYPNPVENVLYINTTESGKYTVRIYDVAGHFILSETVSNNQLDVSNLPSGCYTIAFDWDGAPVNRTFIKN
ncbi:MAG: FG-GAP-like repeat-containing protein [Flavobacteriales bacterium]